MDTKKISFIIPVYNTKNYLTRCLDSILAQKYDNLQVVLVNDGSTDGSDEIIKEYVSKYKNFYSVQQTNKGVGAARNAGLELANGDYICFVDSDDFIYPDFCNYMIQIIGSSDVAIAGRDKYMDEIYISEKKALQVMELDSVTAMRCFFEGKYNTRSVCGRLIRRSCVQDMRFIEGHVFEEIRYSVDLFLRANKVVVADKVLYSYRMRNGSIMSSDIEKQVRDLALSVKYIFDSVRQTEIYFRCKSEFMSWLFLAITRNMKLFVEKDLSSSVYKEAARILHQIYEEADGKVYREFGEINVNSK